MSTISKINQQTEFNNSNHTKEYKIFLEFSPERQAKYPDFHKQIPQEQTKIIKQLNEELNNEYINYINETPHFSIETKQMCINWFINEKSIKLKETALKNLFDHINLEGHLAKVYFSFPDIILEQATIENPHFKKSFYSCTFEEKENRIKILNSYYKTWQIHQPAIQKYVKKILEIINKSTETNKLLTKTEIQEIKNLIPKLLTENQAENLLNYLEKLLESKQTKANSIPSFNQINKKVNKKKLLSQNPDFKQLKFLENLATIHEAQNEYEKLITDYEKILQLSPNHLYIKSKLKKLKSIINIKNKSKNRERELKFLTKRINHFITNDSTLKNLFTETRLFQKITPIKELQEKSSNNSSTNKLFLKKNIQNQIEIFITKPASEKSNQIIIKKLEHPTDLTNSIIWQNCNIIIQNQQNQILSANTSKQYLNKLTKNTADQIFQKIYNDQNQPKELSEKETKQQIIQTLQ